MSTTGNPALLNVEELLATIKKEQSFADPTSNDPREVRWIEYLHRLHRLTNDYIDKQEAPQ